MSCERYEAELALYAEGDLSVTETPALEEHLVACEGCRSFLVELRDSQRMLRSLAADPVPDSSLLSVRRRVTARIARKGPIVPSWAWPLAASLAMVAIGIAVVLVTRDRPPSTLTVEQSAVPSAIGSPSITREVPGPAVAAVAPSTPTVSHSSSGPDDLGPRAASASPRTDSRPRSTVSHEEAVSRVVDPDGLYTAAPLSKEDADQLARAVVAIAAVERVPHLDQDDEVPAVTSRLIQIGTSDPNIVIYWELAPSGGES